MDRCLHVLIVLLLSLILDGWQISSQALGQTLTEKLAAEDPAELVKQARQRGDIVRGAILYHQGNINCVKCHRSGSPNNIGPDLDKLGPQITNESLVESILLPSKIINEKYKTVIARTLDGEVVEGMLQSETPEQVAIRDRENIDKVTILKRIDIEEIKPGKISIMPANLANELKNRGQFLDLLRYVIDIKERGPVGSSTSSVAQNHELTPQLEGLVAIKKFNCTACHVAGDWLSALPSHIAATKSAPHLKWSAKNLNPAYLQAFIANPHDIKSETTMPDLLGSFNESLRKKTAAAIANYLVAAAKSEFETQPLDHEAAQRGYTAFHSIGCVACHSPRDREGNEQPAPGTDRQPLGKLASKYSVNAMVAFLEDPLAARSSGHMPNMRLTRREASDIASFLLQESQQTPVDEFVANESLAERGKTLFAALNCASCHTEFENKSAEPAKQIAIDKLDPAKGCLSGQTGTWAKFAFGSDDINNIRELIGEPVETLSDNQQIDLTLRSYNCIACHQRDELGGVTQQNNPHFTTTNLNLGDQGRIPPALTGAGAKLKPAWMRDVLVNGRSVRPYMNTRMPQYGENNVGHLVELFQKTDQPPQTTFAEFEDQKKTRQWGHELAGNKGLNCVACHTYKFKLSDTMPAVDLTEMAERLKKEWFYAYMLNPQKYSPNTVMPSFWPDGKAIRPDIKGTPSDQVEAIWQYLIDGRQARVPAGVLREPLEIVVTDEAKILRRRYPGIGKRGIGVGYPGGVNITFDAEQMRLAMIWSGKFIDPSAVWTGQGSGVVRLLGKTFEFPRGPDLDSGDTPWVADDGRPPEHQFRGYRLDEKQRPTFRYEFGTTKIEDYFSEATSKVADEESAQLLRTISINPAGQKTQPMRLRLAAGTVQENEGGYSINDFLQINIRSNHPAAIVKNNDKMELTIPLEPTETQQQIQIEYTWKSEAKK